MTYDELLRAYQSGQLSLDAAMAQALAKGDELIVELDHFIDTASRDDAYLRALGIAPLDTPHAD